MSKDLVSNCLASFKKLFASDDKRVQEQQESRIESARVTSQRLKALKRMRNNSPTTPDYKLELEDSERADIDEIDLDFGMEIPKV
jgi:hypothetical protein